MIPAIPPPIGQLRDIPDVAQTTPTDGFALVWVASTSKWTPSASAAISITGNAATATTAGTATNGVVTTGSYADPAWITSLAGAKISGNIAGNAANVTGTVALANGGTGATDAATARTALGLGTIATQAAATVAITGGAIDGATVGATTPIQAQAYRPINTQTGTTYTLVLGDDGKMVTLSNASAITLTVPPNSSVALPVGAEVDLAQLGAGQVTVAPGAGVTVSSFQSKLAIAGQYAGATLKKTATNTWLLLGGLT